MEEYKKCKHCNGEIPIKANNCRHCGKKQSYKGSIIAVIIIVLCIVVLGVYYLNINKPNQEMKENNNTTPVVNSKIKKEIITEENYKELSERVGTELKGDEPYYYIYGTLSYVLKVDQLYGKTVNDLVQEGKQLMKNKNYTVEQFKEDMKKTAEENK